MGFGLFSSSINPVGKNEMGEGRKTSPSNVSYRLQSSRTTTVGFDLRFGSLNDGLLPPSHRITNLVSEAGLVDQSVDLGTVYHRYPLVVQLERHGTKGEDIFV